jgi:hypothetical protein
MCKVQKVSRCVGRFCFGSWVKVGALDFWNYFFLFAAAMTIPCHDVCHDSFVYLIVSLAYWQVYETAQEPIPEDKESINSMHSLSQEATFINQNFSQQVLQKVYCIRSVTFGVFSQLLSSREC